MPVHVPGFSVSSSPSRAVPVMVGALTLLGATGKTGAAEMTTPAASRSR